MSELVNMIVKNIEKRLVEENLSESDREDLCKLKQDLLDTQA